MDDKEIKALIAKYLQLRYRKHKDVIKATGIPESSYYRKMKEPELFSIKELRLIFNYLRIPQTERTI